MKKLLLVFLSVTLAFTLGVPAPAFASDEAGPETGDSAGALAAPQLQGVIGTITEKLSDKSKSLIETQIVLALEDMSANGSSAAAGLLVLFYNATDYTINNIYETVKETLEVVNEIDDEVDALTVRVEELYEEIERGFAQNAYDDCARDLDAAYARLAPLWSEYAGIVAATSSDLPAGERLTQAQLQDKTDHLMKHVYDVYGPLSNTHFEDDLSLVHSAMYSPSGRTTFTDAQIALSRLNLPFEHQIVDDASAAFNYGAALQTSLLWLFGEYANYLLDPAHPDRMQQSALRPLPDLQVNRFASIGDQVFRNLNVQSDASTINDLMRPDEIETTVTLSDGTQLPAYHVIANADEHEYLIGRETLRLGSTYTSYGDGQDDYYTPKHEGRFSTADGRWYVPTTEREMKTLFTPTIANPGSWLSDQGGLSLPAHDALLLADVSNVSESRWYSNYKQYIYSFDQGMLDSHLLTGDEDKVVANSYHNLANNEGTVKWAVRTDEISYRDTQLLSVFFDRANQTSGVPTDDDGYLAPQDPTTLPAEVFLGEGDGLNLTKLSSTDLLGKTVIVTGNATILGGGRTYQNLQIQLRQGASLTVDNLNIDQRDLGKAAIDVFAPDAHLLVAGACSFRGGAGAYLDDQSFLSVANATDGASVEFLGGDRGLNAKESSYGYFLESRLDVTGLAVNIEGAVYGIAGVSTVNFADCDVVVGGGTYDLCGSEQSGGTVTTCYLLDTHLRLEHNSKDHGAVYLSGASSLDNPYRYDLTIKTGDVKNADTDSDVSFSITGTDQFGQTVTSQSVNITDCAGGDYFGRNGVDEFSIEFDVFFADIDYVTLVNHGDDKWYPSYFVIENYYALDAPEYADVRACRVTMNTFIDTVGYEYRFVPDNLQAGASPGISEERIASLLERGSAHGLLRVAAVRDHTVSPLVLGVLQRLGFSARFDIADGDGIPLYRWLFDGARITDPSLATRLGIDIAPLSSDDLDGLLAGKQGLVLRFAHEGALPGEARVDVNAARFGFGPGTRFSMHRVVDGGLEDAGGDVTVGEDGFAPAALEHCSTYALVVESLPRSIIAPTGDGLDTAPFAAVAGASCAVALAAAAGLSGRRRRAR